MSTRIEDYAVIGNMRTAALAAKNGSIDWLCAPRFDSAACFAALLGTVHNGRWLIAPQGETYRVSRRYRDNTLILETEFVTDSGAATLIDFMPIAQRRNQLDVVRIVKGTRGSVAMHMEVLFRFDYGHVVPWVRRRHHGLSAIAGPDAVALRIPVPFYSRDFKTMAEFTVKEGQSLPFVMTWYPSNEPPPRAKLAPRMLSATESWWREWSQRYASGGEWDTAVRRSLITLKALTYAPTGGIVAAATTSLPEMPGGPRNWDYRFCWLRDATFTLYALLTCGYKDEARAWREWLLRAVAGEPQELQIMYGISGERRLWELEVPWLEGYEQSRPVRLGNAAHEQLQLDVYGEVMDTLYAARKFGFQHDEEAWMVQQALMQFLESGWDQPDNGIWEVRGPRRHFTHSKVMAWVALDRAVRMVERFEPEGPLDRWRALRAKIHDDVCRQGFNAGRNAFVQYYGANELDASLLMIPLVGFLPATDPRVVGTVAAIQRDLMSDGLVRRYSTRPGVDGLPAGEGAFLPCTFWLADNLALSGHYEEARAIFQRLLSTCNDVGLLSEEYDPAAQRQLGNFPQALSHVSLINAAHNLTLAHSPARHRAEV
ncbi:MAG TPA: glycoside hydrolase family 15 protein [Candidatus Binataceae bacterium]|nr:glycoside hydrolase family 15 protein [Candidatus Binataceae bacterium]